MLEYVKIAIELLMNWRFWVLIFPVPVGGLAIIIAMLSEKIKEVMNNDWMQHEPESVRRN